MNIHPQNCDQTCFSLAVYLFFPTEQVFNEIMRYNNKSDIQVLFLNEKILSVIGIEHIFCIHLFSFCFKTYFRDKDEWYGMSDRCHLSNFEDACQKYFLSQDLFSFFFVHFLTLFKLTCTLFLCLPFAQISVHLKQQQQQNIGKRVYLFMRNKTWGNFVYLAKYYCLAWHTEYRWYESTSKQILTVNWTDLKYKSEKRVHGKKNIKKGCDFSTNSILFPIH